MTGAEGQACAVIATKGLVLTVTLDRFSEYSQCVMLKVTGEEINWGVFKGCGICTYETEERVISITLCTKAGDSSPVHRACVRGPGVLDRKSVV